MAGCTSYSNRINRIRLEFKDENMVAEPSVGRTVLIESDWNLKADG